MKKLAIIIAALALTGCSVFKAKPDPNLVTWSGRVDVRENITFKRGTRLVIEPGTTIVFAFQDRDGDGQGDISVIMDGAEIKALGTLESPILFTSSAPAAPGLWGEFKADFSKIEMSHTVVEGSTRGLHLHFSSGKITDSIFRRNVDSTRVGESTISFSRCLFSENAGKGYNSRVSGNKIETSWFRRNRRGIFLFEGDRGSVFKGNLFSGNDAPVRLGDFFTGKIAMEGTSLEWGGAAPPTEGTQGYLSEPGQKAELLWTPGPAPFTGPAGWSLFKPAWETEFSGFVDADPALDEGGVYAADWTGNLTRLGFIDGTILAMYISGDTVDSRPVLMDSGGKKLLAFQNWSRKLGLLERETMQPLAERSDPPGPADDHRQSSPVYDGKHLYAGTWSGKLEAWDITGGKLEKKWAMDAGSPIRAGLLADSGKIYLATTGGLLAAVDPTGKRAWKRNIDDSFLSTPVMAHGKLLLATKSGKLMAIDPGTGLGIWTSDLCGPAWYAPAEPGDGLVYQGDDQGCLTAFSPGNGQTAWRIKLDGGIRARPRYENGHIAVPTLGGTLYLIDAKTGFVRDRLTYPEPLQSSPASAGGRLFFGGRDAKMHAVDIIEIPPAAK